jgi:hypothetical protein
MPHGGMGLKSRDSKPSYLAQPLTLVLNLGCAAREQQVDPHAQETAIRERHDGPSAQEEGQTGGEVRVEAGGQSHREFPSGEEDRYEFQFKISFVSIRRSRAQPSDSVDPEQVDLMPAFLGIPKPQEKPAHPRGQTLCAVTGLPAKYLDPISGLPYANAEAFKKLRNR